MTTNKYLGRDGASLFYLQNDGMGGFLNPPKDAEHNFSIVEKRGGHEMSCLSLRGALKETWIPEIVKAHARGILKRCKSELTEEWVQSCYNYFRSCYAPVSGDRNVSLCVIDKENTLPPERHLAYLHIQEFFPDYAPRLDLITNNGKLGSWSKE